MNNSKNTLLILTGALAGVTAAFYFTSPNGKKLLENILGKSVELKDIVQDQVQVLAHEAKQTTQSAIDIASDSLISAKDTVISTAQDVADATEDKVGDFQKGIDKAKKVLNKS